MNPANPADTTTIDLDDPSVRTEYSPAAREATQRITQHWGLTPEQATTLTGHPDNSVLTKDQLTRASYLIGIYAALETLYSGNLRHQWMTIPNGNPLFNGITPADYACTHGTDGLAQVRQLLDAYTH